MDGIVISSDKTFNVKGDFNTETLEEGCIYNDPKDNKLYYYSLTETRPNPRTGFFPVWNGKEKFTSIHAKEKYLSDVISIDLNTMSNNVNEVMAEKIKYNLRRCDNNEILKPQIADGDNMFTQCIKGVICKKDITMIDLIDMSTGLNEHIIESYYSSLTKIAFMRMDKWTIWLDKILHIGYYIEIYKGKKKLVSYKYPDNKFDTGLVKYDSIINTDIDPFKKLIKIIMVMENIQKTQLRSEEIDDYTINNMMTTINSNKPLSAQLFSRFIRMADLSYKINMIDNDKIIFEYKE